MKKTAIKITAFASILLAISCGGKDSKKKTEAAATTAAKTATLEIEKPQLTFGFIKLTDMAPLAIAKEKGFFEEEGLFVSVEAQSNWKNI
jgi:nitrate/nitrite transport system substrate-binding protein